MSKVYFITGVSSGLGRALAQAVLNRGDQAVITARKLDAIAALAEQHKGQALAVQLDVTSETGRLSAIKAAMERFGRIDVLVNNAGQGSLGAAEEFSSAQIRDQMEINFFACVELIRSILPIMREQRQGHILNISSIGGRVNVGGFSVYGAGKFAIEGFSEALFDELKPLGIHVTLIEPGAFRTEFAGSANVRPAASIADYQPVIEPIRQYLYGNAGKQLGDPQKAADVMIQVVESKDPPLRLMLGADAYGLWAQKMASAEADIEKWRVIGEDTACSDVEFTAIGQ